MVVPGSTTSVLPPRSSTDLMPEFLRTRSLVPVMKVVNVNAAWLWREKVLVVEPHSRSTVPLASSAKRVCGVTGT